MGKYIKLFDTHSQYESYTADTENFILPNVSYCKNQIDVVHYSPTPIPQPEYRNRSGETYCEGYDKYVDVYSEVSYDGGNTWETTATTETLVERNSEDCGYVKDSRVIVTYNVTSTTEPTNIFYYQKGSGSGSGSGSEMPFTSMEIDDMISVSPTSDYTFNTIGEHTVKYTLTDPTSISDSVFYNCTGLTSIEIPNSVTSIGEYAFNGCNSLTSVDIPDSVTTIGYQAFHYCTGLTTCTIGSGVTYIDTGAFDGCSSLTNVVIPSGVTSINDSVFYNCTNLTSIEIPSGVTTIGYQAFQGCTSLTSVTIGSGVTSIYGYAFSNCSGLTSIVIPDSVISIDNYAFGFCSGLTSVTIGNSVTSIGDFAFTYCSSLISINIPSGVTNIIYSSFYNCTSITSITVDNNNTTYDSRNNCNAIVETNTNKLVYGCKNTVIPNTVTTIGQHAFQNCSGLTSIVIPDSVVSIGTYAFDGCTSLTSITSNAMTAPTIVNYTFKDVKTNGTLYVPISSSGYNTWMSGSNYYLGKYNWTKVEQ